MRIYVTPYHYNQYTQIPFGQMKKNNFEGIDFAVVEKFKAPIEKFKTNDDFQNWALQKIENEYLRQDFGGRSHETRKLRKSMLNNWFDYLMGNDNYKNTTKLLILNSITKDLKNTTEALPPVLNKNALNATLESIQCILKNNPKTMFDFKKIYNEKLLEECTDKNIEQYKNYTGWIKIPGKAHDEKNFEQNVSKLKLMSHHGWCTKNSVAKMHLANGDFHIYAEDGKPKIGIRLKNDQIKEIQGETNNGIFPARYSKIINAYIAEQQMQLGEYALKELNKVEDQKIRIAKIKKDIAPFIKNNDTEKIFNYFNIKCEKDKDGLLIIDRFEQPDKYYTFKDLGINENKLLENVKTITGNADFEECSAIELKNLRHIGKDAYFSDSKIKKLDMLENIDGDAVFTNSRIKSLNKLKRIGKNADFSKSNVTDLGELVYIGESANFSRSPVTDLNNLQYIGWNVKFMNSLITSLKHLKEIGGSVRFEDSPVIDLGDLKKIGRNAYFQNCGITDLKNLEIIGGDAIFSNSKITNLGKLNYVGNSVFIQNSKLNFRDFDNIGIEEKLYS